MQDAQTLLYDRYAVLQIKRTSNFKKVFYVSDTFQDSPRDCVVKIFKPIVDKSSILQWIEREFEREVNRIQKLSLGSLHLPNIYAYSGNSINYHVVTELVEGKTLQTVVETADITISEVRKITVELLSVLNYIHSQGVIHQNIQPKNIILRQKDRTPTLINFGSIRRIVATYGFCGNKQIFSDSNTYGYAPSEQALDRSVPATDLYSLGLSAVYLLTGKNPVDLPVEADSGNFQIPATVASLDPNLAKVLTRAINPNLSDRYSSAGEMLNDLLQSSPRKSNPVSNLHQKSISSFIKNQRVKQEQNCWQTSIYFMSSACVLALPIITWYDWNLNQNDFVPRLPEPQGYLAFVEETSEALISSEQSISHSQLQPKIDIPIFPVGTSQNQLRQILGQPHNIQEQTAENSSTWTYQNLSDGLVTIGYSFDSDTEKLQQTEANIAASVSLATVDNILVNLLQDNITPSISQALEKVYQHEAEQYLFKLETLEVRIRRESRDRIFLKVWNSDFY